MVAVRAVTRLTGVERSRSSAGFSLARQTRCGGSARGSLPRMHPGSEPASRDGRLVLDEYSRDAELGARYGSSRAAWADRPQGTVELGSRMFERRGSLYVARPSGPSDGAG